jgi:hypothetical protein
MPENYGPEWQTGLDRRILEDVTEALVGHRAAVADCLERRDTLIRQWYAEGRYSQYKMSKWADLSLARVGMICDLSKDRSE